MENSNDCIDANARDIKDEQDCLWQHKNTVFIICICLVSQSIHFTKLKKNHSSKTLGRSPV